LASLLRGGERSELVGFGGSMSAYQIGELIGAIIGMALLGSALAWLIRRVSRVDSRIALAISMPAIAVLAGFTNSNADRPYLSTVALYIAAGIPAFFAAQFFWRRDVSPSVVRVEPSLGERTAQNGVPPSSDGADKQRQGIAWGRGFFRLWLVVALLWCVLAGLVSFNYVANPYVSPKAVATLTGASGPALFDTYGEPYNNWTRGAASGELKLTNVRPGYPLVTLATTSDAELALRITEARQLVDSYIAREVSDKRNSAIAATAGWIITPPLVLLALGALVAWVLAGFRRHAM